MVTVKNLFFSSHGSAARQEEQQRWIGKHPLVLRERCKGDPADSIMLDNEYGFDRGAGVGREYNNDYGFAKRRCPRCLQGIRMPLRGK